MEYRTYKSENGIQLLHQSFPSPIIHCCLVIQTGSRDEQNGEFGAAHFAEHMLFKQTLTRSNEEIISYLEDVGGEINAYTTKEYTCLHASFLAPYLERALDLLSDIAFQSVFPSQEIDKERGVVLDEIASYLEQPEEAIQDDFEELLFEGTTLAHNILGIPSDVKNMTQERLRCFVQTKYLKSKIAFGVHGDVSWDLLQLLFDKYFGQMKVEECGAGEETIKLLKPRQIVSNKNVVQGHLVLGCPTFGIQDERKMTLFLINNILGGGMSSRLNMEIREKEGIAYTIESNYTPFSETGYFSVYLATETSKVEKAEKMVRAELKKIAEQRISNDELQKAKQRFKGLIALGEENRLNVIISMTKSLLDYQKVDSLEEVFTKVDAVSAEDILQVSESIFEPQGFSSLTFLPEED